MAKGPDISAAVAHLQAQKVIAALVPFCSAVEVAGSLRRGRPVVHDIDIVAVFKPGQSAHAAGALAQVCDRNRAFKVAAQIWHGTVGGVPLDVYLATEQTWGMIFLIRTGSAEHNVKLAALAQAQGRAIHYTGTIDGADGVPIHCPTEESVFEALGLDFVAPVLREA